MRQIQRGRVHMNHIMCLTAYYLNGMSLWCGVVCALD